MKDYLTHSLKLHVIKMENFRQNKNFINLIVFTQLILINNKNEGQFDWLYRRQVEVPIMCPDILGKKVTTDEDACQLLITI